MKSIDKHVRLLFYRPFAGASLGWLAALVGALAGCGGTSGELAPSSDASNADEGPTYFPGNPPATIGMGGPPPSAQGDNGGVIADADTTDVADGDTTDGPCAVGERCDTSCTDVNGDPANCGACGRACGDGSVCSDGLCQAACGAGLTSCSGACVDLTTNASHCGACGAPCETGWSCQNGQCVCPGMTCQGRCVDLKSDPENCGGCGYGCAFVLTGGGPPGFTDADFSEIQQFCNDGTCQNYCSLGRNVCGRSCVLTGQDSNNCGQCGVVCHGGATCQSGTCVCADATWTYCDGVCVDTQASAAHCGACGVSCPPGVACEQGACAITCAAGAAGQIACGSSCFDPSTTKEHCGLCNQVCGGDLVCANGACVCPVGTTACGGTCIDLTQDRHNCGSCGNACSASQTCVMGSCQ